ncbi:unnamed protein product [Soboliphyme baturini]|uniref:Protein kinase domain-containing protein n=1 Tax=Soboliphyme baturini TaxID=241478 RepID=A0A183I9B2_9BILA|nr:unnamed protein product [Soboliphyme baturini]
MLYVDPHQRITAANILQHAWITQRHLLPHSKIQFKTDPSAVKAAVMATYKAIKKPQLAPPLEPVSASMLAQRRVKSKVSSVF